MLINTGDGKLTYSYESTPKAGVIEVDEAGVVHAIGVGTATVTTTVEDSETYYYENKTASLTITVAGPLSIMDGASELRIYVGDKGTITANKKVTWKIEGDYEQSLAFDSETGEYEALQYYPYQIRVTAISGNEIKSIFVYITNPLKQISISGTTFTFSEPSTWENAITNFPTENAGWKIEDGKVKYGNKVLKLFGSDVELDQYIIV